MPKRVIKLRAERRTGLRAIRVFVHNRLPCFAGAMERFDIAVEARNWRRDVHSSRAQMLEESDLVLDLRLGPPAAPIDFQDKLALKRPDNIDIVGIRTQQATRD